MPSSAACTAPPARSTSSCASGRAPSTDWSSRSSPRPKGGITATGGPDRLTLTTPFPLEHLDGEARARFELTAGQRLYFALRRTWLGEPVAPPYSQQEIVAALETTITGWRAWSRVHQSYDGPWRELVHHSGRVLQIMFGIGGERDLSERVLPHLAGWCGSRPVRVGNGAWAQPQLDVYGELLDAAFRLREQLGDLEPATRTFLAGLADAAASQWRQPDNGIWEVRGEARHFLYSKVMCWVALDRAVAMADQLHATDRVERWAAEADTIRDAVLAQGWNEQVGAFTQSFGAPELDAAALMLPIVGFLPAADPRVLSTAELIAERLTDDRGLVYRYQADAGVDGLSGGEGTFLLCTFWLARVLAMAGRAREAREVFERAVGYVSDLGLLAEEVDPATGDQLGNFPQAFSHIGLINAAWSIHQAEQR